MPRNQQVSQADQPTVWLLFTNALWTPLVLLANQQNVAAVTKPDPSDIEIDELVASSTGLFSVYLMDSRGNPLMPFENIPIYGELAAGIAQLPFRLPTTIKVPGGLGLSALFSDRSGAQNTIQFCLIGRKVS